MFIQASSTVKRTVLMVVRPIRIWGKSIVAKQRAGLVLIPTLGYTGNGHRYHRSVTNLAATFKAVRGTQGVGAKVVRHLKERTGSFDGLVRKVHELLYLTLEKPNGG